MSIPEILDAHHINEAASLVRDYYTQIHRHGAPMTGARFDSWAGGGDNGQAVNTITADDLIAVTFLSVEIPAAAAIGILETYKQRISELLEQLPADVDLGTLPQEKFDELLGDCGPAQELWQLLRGDTSDRWGIGPTTASKIMARKRPRLIPIYDSVGGSLMGLENSLRQWTVWHQALSGDTMLQDRLATIQELSGVAPDASALRIMDVVLWKQGKNLAYEMKQLANAEASLVP